MCKPGMEGKLYTLYSVQQWQYYHLTIFSLAKQQCPNCVQQVDKWIDGQRDEKTNKCFFLRLTEGRLTW